MDKQKIQRWMPLITVLALLAVLIAIRQCGDGKKSTVEEKGENIESPKSRGGLNRAPSKIFYSKHAQCRMGCRQIDSSEVVEILQKGKINYAKSEIGQHPDCRRKYAVEGVTKRDGQRVRIIFAPCKNEATVVTVIDIGRDWPCDCK